MLRRMMPSLTIDCPAKINLALSVGPRDERGYHPLASWMAAMRFSDRLTLHRRSDGDSRHAIRFADDAPVVREVDWPLEKDLAVRAHRLVEAQVGRPLPIDAQLVKRIPTGAGLGGGSSDAAAMLAGLDRLFTLNLSPATLAQMAGQLGCDVAFLLAALHGQPSALAMGLGEQLEPAPLPHPLHVVLVLPDFACPTGPVYAAFDRLSADRARVDERRVRALTQRQPLAAEELFNDLAAAAEAVQPRLGEALRRLRAALSQPIHVTGSGSAMFVIARSADAADALARRVTQEAGLAAVATRSMGGG